MSLLLHPQRAFASLARSEACGWIGALSVVAMGLGWAAFTTVLAAGDHVPSGPPLLPIAPERYYAWQALFVAPVRFAMFGALAATVHRLSRRLGGEGSAKQTALVAGVAMSLPSALLWLVPDAIVFFAWGFGALAKSMPYYVPLSVVWTVVLVTAGVRAVHGLSAGRALAAALLGLLAHALVGAPFLR